MNFSFFNVSLYTLQESKDVRWGNLNRIWIDLLLIFTIAMTQILVRQSCEIRNLLFETKVTDVNELPKTHDKIRSISMV